MLGCAVCCVVTRRPPTTNDPRHHTMGMSTCQRPGKSAPRNTRWQCGGREMARSGRKSGVGEQRRETCECKRESGERPGGETGSLHATGRSPRTTVTVPLDTSSRAADCLIAARTAATSSIVDASATQTWAVLPAGTSRHSVALVALHSTHSRRPSAYSLHAQVRVRWAGRGGEQTRLDHQWHVTVVCGARGGNNPMAH
jgi:hypothetical protein